MSKKPGEQNTWEPTPIYSKEDSEWIRETVRQMIIASIQNLGGTNTTNAIHYVNIATATLQEIKEREVKGVRQDD